MHGAENTCDSIHWWSVNILCQYSSLPLPRFSAISFSDLFELGETQTDREVIEMSLLQLGEYLTQLLASRPLGHEPDHLFDEFEIIAICK